MTAPVIQDKGTLFFPRCHSEGTEESDPAIKHIVPASIGSSI